MQSGQSSCYDISRMFDWVSIQSPGWPRQNINAYFLEKLHSSTNNLGTCVVLLKKRTCPSTAIVHTRTELRFVAEDDIMPILSPNAGILFTSAKVDNTEFAVMGNTNRG